MGQPEGQFPPPGPAAPSTTRIYNYLIGGDIHYPADRAAARRILADFPEFAQLARANREFVTRAVHYVATQGVIQFIDLGTGLPASPAVHETARRASPGARVAYVDHDPLVLEHARGAAAGHPGLAVVPGDLRQPDGILAHPELRRVYASTSDITGRPAEEIAAWFTGLDLVPPGLAEVQSWPAGQGQAQAYPAARMLGAVGRRPARNAPARHHQAGAADRGPAGSPGPAAGSPGPPAGGGPAGRGGQATNAYRTPGSRSAGGSSGNYGPRDSKVPRVTSGSSETSEH